jgi:hypothetical protein
MLIYVAGPYSGDVEHNIARARAVAIQLFEKGHSPITPHLNFAHFENDMPEVPNEAYMVRDLGILDRCDGMVVVEGWQNSEGTEKEINYCRNNGIPVWFAPILPELHLTEQRYPVQCTEFAKLMGSLYRLHLEKNRDYSGSNILGTGEVGMVARLWDKMARLLNLTGFHIKVSGSTFEKPLDPANESIDDTYKDLACYAAIGSLLRAGHWGR